ncbi:MAG TPA: DEAD/DEAH box helicase [Solimonas sp.]|nr:DEAD/DEAH box helicase [Solimonas sp.]
MTLDVPERFTTADLLRRFDGPTVLRGKQYWQDKRLRNFELSEQPEGIDVAAQVAGSEALPYEVRVHAQRPNGNWQWSTSCSCPVGADCKHVIAALLEACDRWQRDAPAGAGAAGADGPLPPEIAQWLDRIRDAQAPRADPAAERKCLVYLFAPDRWRNLALLRLATARMQSDGGIRADRLEAYQAVDAALRAPPRFLSPEDLELLRALYPFRRGLAGEYQLHGAAAVSLLEQLLDTRRCFWEGRVETPLRRAEPRPAHVEWHSANDGSQHPRLHVAPEASALLRLTPPWYVDGATGECGEVQSNLPPRLATLVLDAPQLPVTVLPQVAERLAQLAPADALPPPKIRPVRQVKGVHPVPVLRLYGRENAGHFRAGPRAKLGAARVLFDYRGSRVAASDPVTFVTRSSDDEILQIERDRTAENRALASLAKHGHLEPAHKLLQVWEMEGIQRDDLTLAGPHAEEGWTDFMLHALPKLQAAHWRIEYDLHFPHRYVDVEEWFGGVEEEADAGSAWFKLALGIQVGGQQINLLPLLVDLLQRDPAAWSPQRLKEMPADAVLSLELPDGRRVALPYARVARILQTLIELYDGDEEVLDEAGMLRLNRLDAARLAELQAADAASQIRWLNADRLLDLGQRLSNFQGIAVAKVPAGLKAELRPYQREGLSWLQFLREYEFGGILADDMGLGKTVQTLTHILLEKESGRLDRPALVVAPTSLVGNWQREAREFTPDLRVLALHGLGRKQHFKEIQGYDLVVTTYPLLPRDKEVLLKQEFHLIVLDEAQNIKNSKSLAAQLVQQLKSRHRLCLTGTPMENHLGELWSQFHFLQPGLLGGDKEFKRRYRVPIEKNADEDKRAHLVRRIAPFLLRRTKQQVVKELPPKTEIVRSVALGGRQRDLYETVRLAMNDKVREEISQKGLNRSHIVILDALLKLRQICCDPRLMKSRSAADDEAESAKLELLMDILPEMLEEGRKVLLFSQFTSMLELIEQRLTGLGIRYLKLTGDTDSQQRTRIVERFQANEVPLFLVSLKAGGVGLNLTAADTVIHYDPWWNPAVENQATDRAYRIGQDKPVFVYKLIVEGSVEEKIQALQARKAALAAAILGGGAGGEAGLQLAPDDLQALFEPLA